MVMDLLIDVLKKVSDDEMVINDIEVNTHPVKIPVGGYYEYRTGPIDISLKGDMK